MKTFPTSVRDAMVSSGATVTCVPVRIDGDAWETAVFFDVAGPECAGDRRVLGDPDSQGALGVEGDLVETSRGAVVILRFEAYTMHEDPLAGEVLLTPGGSQTHLDALKHLTGQPRISWFFAGEDQTVIRAQHYPLGAEHHAAFAELLGDAVRHDALTRMTTGYDAATAVAEVAARYAPGSGTDPRAGRSPS